MDSPAIEGRHGSFCSSWIVVFNETVIKTFTLDKRGEISKRQVAKPAVKKCKGKMIVWKKQKVVVPKQIAVGELSAVLARHSSQIF